MENPKECYTHSASSTSSSSSVTQFVNELYPDSELETSKVISLEVSYNVQWTKNPMADVEKAETKLGENKLHNFTASSDATMGSSTQKFRKMYTAALAVLFFPVCMGITATYSATATDNMRLPHSSIKPNDDEITWIGSLMAIGALVGGTAGGYFTNSLGRKGALIFNTAPFVIGWLVIAYAPTLWYIFVGRILTGFCCGILSVATPMYLVEISTPEVRGLLGACFQLFVVIGVLIVASLGSLLTWRWLAISGAGMSLLAAALMVPCPESPRWLMAQKRKGEAINALTFLQGEEFDAKAECQSIEDEIQNQPKGAIHIKEFLAPSVYKPLILSILLMFFQQFSGVNAVMFYTVDIFAAAHSSMDPKLATITVAVVQVFATLLSSILMDRAGRKVLLIISGFAMAVSLFVFGGFDFAASRNESVATTYGWLPLVCLMSFIAAFSIGFGPTPWLMVAEMTPSRFRSIISGIATALNWAFVFTVTKSFKALERGIHDYGVYWGFASYCAISCLVTFFFLPETKGKKMEEIQRHFNK